MFSRIWRAVQNIPRPLKVALIASACSILLINHQNPTIMSSPQTASDPSTKVNARIPSAYIPHGGGPLPILGDSSHTSLVAFLSKFASKYLTSTHKPTSCLVVSAHWEEKVTTLQSGDTSSLYYDYYGFPKESYNLSYPLRPAPDLAKRVATLLDKAGIGYKIDKERGFDHGVFIPMMLIYPGAEIPTLQISLVAGLDPEKHVKLGEALAPLRDEGVFILGSGMSYHNMAGFRSANANVDSIPFHAYLRDMLTSDGTSYEDKKKGLETWKKAPKARETHPREEHLIPLMVLLGTAKAGGGMGIREVFFDDVGGAKCSGYVFEE